MSENKINIETVQLPDGIAALEIRQGVAPKINQFKGYCIVGSIEAPAEFLSKRNIDPNTAIISYNLIAGWIVLSINEGQSMGQISITGKLTKNPAFDELLIERHAWDDPTALAIALQRKKHILRESNEGKKLISALKNFNASVQKQMEKINDDQSGHYRTAVDMTVSSNLPKTISLFMPVFEGYDKKFIDVDIVVEAPAAGGLKFHLVCHDLEKLIEDESKKIIQVELDKINSDIVVIHQI